MNAFQLVAERASDSERWRAIAPGLLLLPERHPMPPVDPSSDIGRLLVQGGFLARHRVTGLWLLCCDARGVALADLRPIQAAYGLHVRELPGLCEPGVSQLLVFTVKDALLAKKLFRIHSRSSAPIDAPAALFLPPTITKGKKS